MLCPAVTARSPENRPRSPTAHAVPFTSCSCQNVIHRLSGESNRGVSGALIALSSVVVFI
jgi:hypothetical protein